MKYKAIFERNADRLVNANTIYEGVPSRFMRKLICRLRLSEISRQ